MRYKKILCCVLVILFLNTVAVTCFHFKDKLTVMTLSKYGSKGDEVTQVQTKLQEKGYYTGKIDGIFGSKTKEALLKYQKDVGLTADGIAGPNTLSKLGITSSSTSSASQIKNIQSKLKEKGYYSGNIDGILGSKTREAIVAFQNDVGLVADGIAGPKTLAKLGLSSSQSSEQGSVDINLLAKVISAESRGEPYVGQVAVGAVILNRIDHPSFPNTLSGVVYQPGAFTCMTDGQINEPTADSSKRAAQDAINGWDPSGGAIYYYNPEKSTNQWIFSRPVITVIGKHRFCN